MVHSTVVEHLNDTESDHYPLLVHIDVVKPKGCKPFRFLEFWCEHPSFMDLVRDIWSTVECVSPIVRTALKLKRLRKALGRWSREMYGDIFQELRKAEDKVSRLALEEGDGQCPERWKTLNAARANLKRRITTVESFWRQKARQQWDEGGDKNTRYFHNCVKGRRKRLVIHRISTEGGVLSSQEDMQRGAVLFYSKLQSRERVLKDEVVLGLIQPTVSATENAALIAIPTMEEVVKVVFDMRGDGAPDPDGFTGLFFFKGVGR